MSSKYYSPAIPLWVQYLIIIRTLHSSTYRSEFVWDSPLNSPICFSEDSAWVVSGSLKLEDSGSKSCWKSKPEIEYDRPRACRGESTSAGPSESSKSRKESSVSFEWRDSCREDGYCDGDLSDIYEDSEDGIETKFPIVLQVGVRRSGRVCTCLGRWVRMEPLVLTLMVTSDTNIRLTRALVLKRWLIIAHGNLIGLTGYQSSTLIKTYAHFDSSLFFSNRAWATTEWISIHRSWHASMHYWVSIRAAAESQEFLSLPPTLLLASFVLTAIGLLQFQVPAYTRVPSSYSTIAFPSA